MDLIEELYQRLDKEESSLSSDVKIDKAICEDSFYAFSVTRNSKRIAFVFIKDTYFLLSYHSKGFRLPRYMYLIHACLSEGKIYVVNQKDNTINGIDDLVSGRRKYAQEFDIDKTVELIVNACLTREEEITRIFKSLLTKYRTYNSALESFLVSLSTSFSGELSPDKNSYSFMEEDENRLFDILYKNRDVFQVCRYTSLSTMFSMLSSGKIRFIGLAGMNDKSESVFLQNLLYGKSTLKKGTWLHHGLNDTYIISFSSMDKKDVLDMWRMYADDGKGVCLTFELSDYLSDNFNLAPVLYDNPDDKHENYRIELLKDLVALFNKIECRFEFRHFNKWCTYTKSKEYSNEDEIRLCYTDSRQKSCGERKSNQWMITSKNKIITPYLELDLFPMIDYTKADIFPMRLTGIMLGPKCDEKELNREQIIDLLDMDPYCRFMYVNVNVEISSITNYR